MALQDHGDIIPQRALNARPFVKVKGHPFIGVVADALVKLGANLIELQQAVLAGGHRHPRQGVGVDHAVGVFPGHMHRAVDGEARRVSRRVALNDFALHIHHDQVAGGDFVKHHAEGVN